MTTEGRDTWIRNGFILGFIRKIQGTARWLDGEFTPARPHSI